LGIAVVERMTFDLGGKTIVVRIERRAFGYRLGFEHTIELKSEMIVQSRRVMSLDDEAAAVRRF
jgi:hypothetical protein